MGFPLKGSPFFGFNLIFEEHRIEIALIRSWNTLLKNSYSKNFAVLQNYALLPFFKKGINTTYFSQYPIRCINDNHKIFNMFTLYFKA